MLASEKFFFLNFFYILNVLLYMLASEKFSKKQCRSIFTIHSDYTENFEKSLPRRWSV
jgi:hypothetical protein